MSTSIQQLDHTYGHLLGTAENHIRGVLDASDGVRGVIVDLAGGAT